MFIYNNENEKEEKSKPLSDLAMEKLLKSQLNRRTFCTIAYLYAIFDLLDSFERNKKVNFLLPRQRIIYSIG